MIRVFRKKYNDRDIIAPVKGKMIPIENVNDAVFAEKVLGDGVAFEVENEVMDVCAPANGTVSMLYNTGHAFGITTKEGVELIVHIGIDTVNSHGQGFRLLKVRQRDNVAAGTPIVRVDFPKLAENYDMPVMLIITNPNEKKIRFITPQHVKSQQIINLNSSDSLS